MKNFKVLFGFYVSFFLLSTSAISQQKSIEVGPSIGEKSPRLVATDHNSQYQSISQLSGAKGTIILFFRSADWCPFCKKHLIEMNKQAQNLKDLGYGLTAISYDDNQVLNEFSYKHHISYPLLSDVKAQTMLNYGILNTQYKEGSEHYGIPYPGVVVIDKNGNITHKHFFEGYKKRVKFTELYQKLKSL